MQNPEGHRDTLYELAAALHAEGLIDQLEQFDMNEMADAAYWHAVEELQSSPGQYRGASTYNVVQIDNGNLLGTISRSIFNFANDEPRGASFAYDGKVYSDADGVRLTLGAFSKDWADFRLGAGNEWSSISVGRDRTNDRRRNAPTTIRCRCLPSAYRCSANRA